MGSGLFGLEERVVSGKQQHAAREALLASRGLSMPACEDLVIGLFDGEELVATGSLVGEILQGIAVSASIEGEGAAARIVSALIRNAFDRGRRHLFLYTTSDEAKRFEDLGFSLIASVRKGAALLEWGDRTIHTWLDTLGAIVKRDLADSDTVAVGAIVVNCNPFTLGHRALIEYASSQCRKLYVIVLEEDASLFPFEVRYELVCKGTSDLAKVQVLKGGPYVISAATFPTYFIKKGGEALSTSAVDFHARLDLSIFRRYIAPALGAKVRFVGTEPYCPTTSMYNSIMKEVLTDPEGDGPVLDVYEMPRFEKEGAAVSASKVRSLIRNGALDLVRNIVPETTWAWLNSSDAISVINRIIESDSRH
jgi:[citrate (pro-3S)-lyase] ligase